MRLIDRATASAAPEMWPGLVLLAMTAFLEAEGEPEEGQLAVAYNPCNRARREGVELHSAILGIDMKAYNDGRPYEIYSCWNDDYRRQAYNRATGITDGAWEHFFKLACAAWWQLTPDPSNGAYFYLNVEETKRIRPNHDLPDWWDIDGEPASEVVIGRHTFRRHR